MKPPKLTITFDLSETADRLREAANALDPQPTSVATRCNHEPLTSCPCADIARNEMLRELMAALGEADTARPETPSWLWEQMLRRVDQLREAAA